MEDPGGSVSAPAPGPLAGMLGSVQLDALLRAHSFLRVERPPALWEIDAEDVPFVRALGEMIAASLGRGNGLADLVLEVVNVTVEEGADDSGEEPRPGDYVALTIRGRGDWGREVRWWPDCTSVRLVTDDLGSAALAAGARFGYVRSGRDESSVTIFYPRLLPPI